MSTPVLISILIIVAFLISVLGSISGVGGGILFVPILMLILSSKSLNEIKFLSTIAVFAASFINFCTYCYKKELDWRIIIISILTSVPVIFLGYELQKIIPDLYSKIIIIILLLVVVFLLIFEKKLKAWKEKKNSASKQVSGKKNWYQIDYQGYLLNIFTLIFIIVCGSLLTSLSGMGGGPLLMPLLIITFNLTVSKATPISHTIIFIASFIMLLRSYQSFSNLQLILTNSLPMLLGVTCGTLSAIWLKKIIKKEFIIKVVLIILILMSIAKMIYDIFI